MIAKNKVRKLRPNILILFCAAYGTVLAVYAGLVFFGNKDSDAAFRLVNGPLMTLIGGTLAVAKDLLHPPSDESAEKGLDQPNSENGNPGKDQPSDENDAKK